jgi:hypothetical protein
MASNEGTTDNLMPSPCGGNENRAIPTEISHGMIITNTGTGCITGPFNINTGNQQVDDNNVETQDTGTAKATKDTEESTDSNVLEGQNIGTTKNSMNDCQDTVVTPLPHSNQGSNEKEQDTSAPSLDGTRLSRTAEEINTTGKMLARCKQSLNNQKKQQAPDKEVIEALKYRIQ